MVEKRKTAGQIQIELLDKHESEGYTHSSWEQASSMLSGDRPDDFMPMLIATAERGQKEFPARDFFVAVRVKSEQLLPTFYRNQFGISLNCPVPNYDQHIFKFHETTGQLEHLWTIPDKKTCKYFLKNPTDVQYEDERPLIRFIHDFADGTLVRRWMDYNTPQKKIIKTVS